MNISYVLYLHMFHFTFLVLDMIPKIAKHYSIAEQKQIKQVFLSDLVGDRKLGVMRGWVKTSDAVHIVFYPYPVQKYYRPIDERSGYTRHFRYHSGQPLFRDVQSPGGIPLSLSQHTRENYVGFHRSRGVRFRERCLPNDY